MFEGGQISEGGDKFPRKFGPGGTNFPGNLARGGQIFGGDIFPVTPAKRASPLATSEIDV